MMVMSVTIYIILSSCPANDDVHTDMKWSFDIKDALKEIYFMLNVSYILPLKEYRIPDYRCIIGVRHILNYLTPL